MTREATTSGGGPTAVVALFACALLLTTCWTVVARQRDYYYCEPAADRRLYEEEGFALTGAEAARWAALVVDIVILAATWANEGVLKLVVAPVVGDMAFWALFSLRTPQAQKERVGLVVMEELQADAWNNARLQEFVNRGNDVPAQQAWLRSAFGSARLAQGDALRVLIADRIARIQLRFHGGGTQAGNSVYTQGTYRMYKEVGGRPNDIAVFQFGLQTSFNSAPVDFRPQMMAARDQGAVGCCVAYATAGIMEFLYETRPTRVSPEFLYHLRCNVSQNCNVGMIPDGLNVVLSNYGCCLEYLYNPRLTESVPTLAAMRRTSASAFADAYRRRARLVRLPNAQSVVYWMQTRKSPVLLFAAVTGNWQNMTVTDISQPAIGWHAMAIVAWTGSSYIVRNQWGATWGDGTGHCVGYRSIGQLDTAIGRNLAQCYGVLKR